MGLAIYFFSIFQTDIEYLFDIIPAIQVSSPCNMLLFSHWQYNQKGYLKREREKRLRVDNAMKKVFSG